MKTQLRNLGASSSWFSNTDGSVDPLRLRTKPPDQLKSKNGGLDTLEMEPISGLNTFDFAEEAKRR